MNISDFILENELLNHEPRWLHLFILLSDVDSPIGIYLKNKLRICDRCVTLFNCKVSFEFHSGINVPLSCG